jgi:hypothetical protein
LGNFDPFKEKIKRNIFTPQVNDIQSRYKNPISKQINNTNETKINHKEKNKNKQFYKTLNNFIDHSHGGKTISKFSNKFRYEDASKDIIELNPLLYNLGYEKVKNETIKKELLNNKEKIEHMEKLQYLKEIAFMNIMNKDRAMKKMKMDKNKERDLDNSDFLDDFNEIENPQKNNNMNYMKFSKKKNNKVDEDNVMIGGITYSRYNVDMIAKQVLKNCNFNSDKNKNNNTRLLSGNGKLAITSGMTLNDFAKKFNFD